MIPTFAAEWSSRMPPLSWGVASVAKMNGYGSKPTTGSLLGDNYQPKVIHFLIFFGFRCFTGVTGLGIWTGPLAKWLTKDGMRHIHAVTRDGEACLLFGGGTGHLI